MKTVKLGIAGAFSGTRTAHTPQLKWGALLAVRHWELRKGTSIRVYFGDEQADGRLAPKVARDLTAEKVDGVVGHFSSECAIAAAPIYQEAGIPLMVPAATHPDLSKWPHVFRLCAQDEQLARLMAKWVSDRFSSSRVILVDDGSLYGRRLMDYVDIFLDQQSLGPLTRVTWSHQMDPSEKKLITRKWEKRYQAVLFGGRSHVAGDLADTFTSQGSHLPLLFGDDALNPQFLQQIERDCGVVWVMGFLPPKYSRKTAPFIDDYQRINHDNPGYYAAATYAATEILLQAVEKRKKGEEGLLQLISANKWDSLLGEVVFDEQGDWEECSLGVWEVKKGGFHLLERCVIPLEI
ncbi:branched-chain amino acid ABC transporter substrate-binding protein [Desmospora profundinema]|uniref:Branched-chain amino acid transport system substrate-binding protein n=1 Tax=Desmospora profundinema TaxID=1571184 RepID=A0ABU1IRC9_9BACL|nr:branched-chain amino acid ABC transporter substrate-binding protein [Desmospora profundinema]MDR6227352.1 branched-chain amino acid transport system substrate-binding protein [Desmospora profundinema]